MTSPRAGGVGVGEMMDVWVLWRDTGAYSDWERVVLGAYATLTAAQMAAAQDADCYHRWIDDAPVHAVLGEWEQDTNPPESWTTKPVTQEGLPDEMDYTAARFTVSDGAPPPAGAGG